MVEEDKKTKEIDPIKIAELMDKINNLPKFNLPLESMKQLADNLEQWNKNISEKLKPTIEIIKKIQQNNKDGKEIRGAIITSVIDLDELLENIILKKYVKSELHTEFTINVFGKELFSTYFKYKVITHSGLLDKELNKNIQNLIEIRNIIAHSKYIPTVETVQILHKTGVKDIQSLKREFDLIFYDTMDKLEEVLNKI